MHIFRENSEKRFYFWVTIERSASDIIRAKNERRSLMKTTGAISLIAVLFFFMMSGIVNAQSHMVVTRYVTVNKPWNHGGSYVIVRPAPPPVRITAGDVILSAALFAGISHMISHDRHHHYCHSAPKISHHSPRYHRPSHFRGCR